MAGASDLVPGGMSAEARLRTAFPHATESTMNALLASDSRVEHALGTEIGAERGAGPPLVILERGALARIARSPEGVDVAYGVLRPGGVAGVAGISSVPDLGFVLMAWLDSITIEWPRERIRGLAAADGSFALDLLDIAIELASAVTTELEELRSVPAETRLARVLLRYPELFFDPDRSTLRRGNLATLMGTSREMMERCIRLLEDGRIIVRTGSAGLVLLDEPALRRVAG